MSGWAGNCRDDSDVDGTLNEINQSNTGFATAEGGTRIDSDKQANPLEMVKECDGGRFPEEPGQEVEARRGEGETRIVDEVSGRCLGDARTRNSAVWRAAAFGG
jgi:hypothetical protein